MLYFESCECKENLYQRKSLLPRFKAENCGAGSVETAYYTYVIQYHGLLL